MELRLTPPTAELSTTQSPAASVAVLAPCLHGDIDAVCRDLQVLADPGQLRVLVVDVTASPARVRRRWAEHVEAPPRALEVIGVEYMEPESEPGATAEGRSGGDGQSPTLPASLPEAETTYVQEPGDLSGIGVAASATLREWADADEQVVVCLRSLTTVLQYADDGPTLAFLRELLGHCERADALAHVHLDPTAVDERTVEGVREQVDAVVELSPE